MLIIPVGASFLFNISSSLIVLRLKGNRAGNFPKMHRPCQEQESDPDNAEHLPLINPVNNTHSVKSWMLHQYTLYIPNTILLQKATPARDPFKNPIVLLNLYAHRKSFLVHSLNACDLIRKN